MSLEGRAVLVTGGAGGIGRAVSRRLAEAGARVGVADLAGEDARTTAASVGGHAIGLSLDVTDEEACDRAVSAMIESFGGLDGLVHCAGVGVERPALDTTLAEWTRILSVNLTGAFLMCRAAARRMGEGASLVTIASTAGERGSARRAAYGASKAGVINLTQALAVELAPRGVRANVISPGPIETELVRRMHAPDTRAGFERRTPLGRYGRPEEVAGAALFLLSEDAAFVTGHVLRVDGGFAMAGIMSAA